MDAHTPLGRRIPQVPFVAARMVEPSPEDRTVAGASPATSPLPMAALRMDVLLTSIAARLATCRRAAPSVGGAASACVEPCESIAPMAEASESPAKSKPEAVTNEKDSSSKKKGGGKEVHVHMHVD